MHKDAYGPCTRLRPRKRPVHGRITAVPYRRPVQGRVWAVHTAREHGPSTPPVYMTVYGPSVRTSSTVYMAHTWPRTHGRVHDKYTAAYTCLRVQGPCTRPCTGHLHGRKRPSTRPCNVSCIRPCTGRIGSCTRVHCRLRPSTYRVHGRVTVRVPGRYTAVYKGRLGRVYGR